MKKLTEHFCRRKLFRTPWLNQHLISDLNSAIQRANESQTSPEIDANAAISWLVQNKAESKLREALAAAVPLIRVDDPDAETWFAPHPSGGGNAVVVVSGLDSTGTVRMLYSNRCQRPEKNSCRFFTNDEFFYELKKCATNCDKAKLLQSVLNGSLPYGDYKWAAEVHDWSRTFRTMPVYVVVVTDGKPLLVSFPAVIHRARFCDFSLETVGEV